MSENLTVKARYEADVAGYVRAMQTAARETDKAATSADKLAGANKKAADASTRAADRVAAAQDKVRDAQDRAADAAGRLKIAQAKLADARDGGNPTAIIAAEERLATAQRDVESTTRKAAAAQGAYEIAVEQSAQAVSQYAADAQKAATGTSRLADAVKSNAQDLETVGQGLAAAGAGMLTFSGLSAKAAMDWESAFTGVKKTVDDTAEGYAQLEDELRGLATTLPTTHAEVAAVAEAAGQLGVARGDIVGFTKTMIDLGESTNLTADEAATQIAQISNVMGTMEREGAEGVARFGGALVALGNDGASTEADILAMAQRISGAGATVGATEADVLALSNTLASMGVKAELGGGVTTRVLLKMKAGVESGGESLEAFARTAGVSADEFSAKFKSSPVEAMNLVAQGIARVNAEGGATTQTLKDMGMKGTEEAQVMLALAASGDLLTDSLKLGAEAWAENTASNALATEANKRYEDSASRVRIAWNQIQDAAIEAGAAVLPVVADLAEAADAVAGAFGDLPDPVKSALGLLGGVGGVVLTAAGGFMMLAPRVLESVDAARRLKAGLSGTPAKIDAVGDAADRNKNRVNGLGKALGGLATAATVGITIGSLVPSGATAEADALAAAVTRIGTGGEQAALGVDELNRAFTGNGNWFDGLDVQGIDEAFRIMGNPSVADNVDQIASKVLTFGTRSSTNVEFAKKNFEALDQQLASMAQGGSLDAAKATFDQLSESAKAQGVEQEKVNEMFPAYAAALSRAEAEASAAAQSTDELGKALEGAAGPASDTTESLGALAGMDTSGMVGIQNAIGAMADESAEFDEILGNVMDALFQLGVMEQSAAEAAASYEAALDGISASVEENGRTLDITTEKGRANQDALFGIADAGRALMTASAEAGASQGELRAQLEGTYDDLVAAGEQMGLTANDARALAEQILGVPGGVDIETWMDNSAMVMAEATTGAIEAIPGYKGVAIAVSENGTVGSVQEKIDATTGKTVQVWVDEDGSTTIVQQEIRDIAGVQRTVWVDDQGTVYATQRDINDVTGKVVDVEARALTGEAERDLNRTARDRWVTFNARFLGGDSTQKATTSYDVGLAAGGVARLPGYSSGGMLPYTGLGTDMILGVTSSGMPIARVDDGEWIINERSSREFNGVLSAINDRDPRVAHLRGFAAGGVPAREWPAVPAAAVQVMASAPAVDAVAIGQIVGAEVRHQLADMRPVWQIGNREFKGLMVQANNHTRGR